MDALKRILALHQDIFALHSPILGMPIVENASGTAVTSSTLSIGTAGNSTFGGVIQDGAGGGMLSLNKVGWTTPMPGSKCRFHRKSCNVIHDSEFIFHSVNHQVLQYWSSRPLASSSWGASDENCD